MNRRAALLVLLIILTSVITPTTLCAKDDRHLSVKVGNGVEVNAARGEARLKLGKSPDTETTKVEIIEGENGVKYNWVLSKYPESNRFTATIEYEGAEFYYQPPLDQQTYPAGWRANATHVFNDKGKLVDYRPIDVVGSYAVYYSAESAVDGTGKIMHIYRPLVIDAAGKTTWGVLKIEGGVLSVTVDDAWLRKAKYPVTVDPLLGYSTIGGSALATAANTAVGQLVTATANATVEKIGIYATGNDASSGIKGAVWSATTQDVIQVATGVAWDTTPAWKNETFSTNPTIISGTNYIIGCVVAETPTLQYDTATGYTYYIDTTNSYATPNNIGTVTTSNRRLSLYVYYSQTVTSGAVTDLDNTYNLYTARKYYTLTTVVDDDDGLGTITAVSAKFTTSTGTTLAIFKGSTLTTTPTWTVAAGHWSINATACTWSNVTGTATFKVLAPWNVTSQISSIHVSLASGSVNSTWTKTATAQVISRLVTTGFTGNVTGTTSNQPVRLTGYVRYAMNITGSTQQNNASAYYPPDAQFTSVKIYTGEDVYSGIDTTIVNGAFTVDVTSPSILGTTYYYAWLDLVSPYTDGYAPDADYVALSVTSNFFLSQLIEQAAALFGAVFPGFASFLDGLSDMTGSFAAYFGGTVTSIVNGITMVFKIMVGFATFALDWGTRIADWVVDITTEVLNILNGTSAAATGLGNIWTLLNVANWIDFIPLMLILFWLESLDVREKKQGGGWVQIAIGDIQIATYLLGLIMEYSWMVFNFVFNTIINLASLIPGL